MQSQNDKINEIKAHIANLHERSSGDYESLIRQVSQHYKPIKYNLPQMLSRIASEQVRILVNEWGRGTGKSTDLGGQMKSCVISMPRSNNNIIGSTYKEMLTRTLPSTIAGLEAHGIFKNLHFFIGSKPPPKWRSTWGTPYQGPDDYSKYITFWNGSGYNLISQDVPGDGRGLNVDSEAMDETAQLNKEKLDSITSPSLRGSKKEVFENSPYFRSSYRVSSTPLTLAGRWFIEQEEESLRFPDKIRFIRADSRFNAHNLADGWLEDQRDLTLPWIYEAEYMNVRPSFSQDMFYYLFDENKHGYTSYNYNYYTGSGIVATCQGDSDLDLNSPILIGCDWGSAINSCIVAQRNLLELRILKNFYVLSVDRKNQTDLFEEVDRYYSFKKQFNNTIYLYYDHTGNIETGFTKLTRAQEVKKQLEGLGWRVILITAGRANPLHEKKFRLYELLLKENDSNLPQLRFNIGNCRELIIAMQHTKTKIRSDIAGIKKDKSSEQSSGVKRVFATDLTDALDSVVYQLYSQLLTTRGRILPADIIST